MKRGYAVSIPFSEDCAYDLVVERNGVLERVQCKYTEGDGSFVEVRCRCTNNWATTKYTAATVDWIAVYDRTTNRCYFVPARMLGAQGRSVIHLRIRPARNGQTRGVHWAADFTEW